ncbi:MAG: hypothetical protein ACOYZ7_00055 [Chloroflexota bacterium]
MAQDTAGSKPTIVASLALLSTATLAFEVNLSRLFAVAQFYHFAFMIVSLALLGFGASGAFLALAPRLRQCDPARALGWLGRGFAAAVIGSYALTLYLPFDSFRIALDWHQWAVLAAHYLALALPFFCSGAAVAILLAAHPGAGNRIYAANLAGSAVGCGLAVVLPSLVGGEGVVLVSAALGIGAATMTGGRGRGKFHTATGCLQVGAGLFLILAAIFLPQSLEIRLSPYKSLSYALLYPDAELVFRRWNGFSRVDVVRSSAIRSLPGSGFRCAEPPPPQMGLTVDGDDLLPISHAPPGLTTLPFTDCLLTALPYRLRPGARALLLEPRGGFDVLVALAEGATAVTAVEANPLVIEAVRQQGDWAGNLYDDARVDVVLQEGRAFVRQTRQHYDVVQLALTAPQRTIVSGAYSLSEDYTYTVEALVDYLTRLDDGGLLVMTRWLQVPPSESLRAFGLAVEAIERTAGEPRLSLVALRSYRQMIILARRGAFTAAELQTVRAFAAPRAFDLVYLPDIQPDEVNRYNVLPSPDYYHAFVGLLQATDREAWYRQYPFDVRPPSDDRPFFGHYFKWQQASEVLAMAGHTWQPFGGAGYFVLLALLALATIAAAALILLPLAFRRTGGSRGSSLRPTLLYFILLGMGYLCVEIPLMQRFILFLGHPSYALAAVLFALLLFSGLGSLLSVRLPLGAVLLAIPALVGGYVLALPLLFEVALAASLGGRLAVTVMALAPLGLLMGMPLPKGIAALEGQPTLVAWAWAGNGASSVVASVMAALLALSWGFSTVLAVGAVCYGAAWLTAPSRRVSLRPGP